MNYITGTLNNTLPIRWKDLGSESAQLAEHVTPEVLVSYVIQRMFGKKDKDGLMDLAFIHSFSIPFIGGLGKLIAPENHPGFDADYATQLQAGLAGVPAVLLAQYFLSIFKGSAFFHWNFNMRNFLITSLSKIITRPLVSTLGGFVGEGDMSRAYDALQARFDKQAKAAFNYGNMK